MKGGHLRRRTQADSAAAPAGSGRSFVVRRTALGYRVFVHHAYGRIARLAAPSEPEGADFADHRAVARALAREVLRRTSDEAETEEIAELVEGPGPRWEIAEDDVRAAAGRARRTA